MLSARLSRAASIAALTLFPALVYVPAAHAVTTYDAVVYDGGVNDGIVNGNGLVLALPSYQPVVALDTSTGTVTVTVTQVSNGATMPERMVFAPPTGDTSLTVGTTYPTSKAPTASTAGLDARNGTAQCLNGSTGHLTVNRLDTDPTTPSTVTAFAATFDQTCTGRTGTLFGEVRLHAPEGFRAARVAPLNLSFGNVPVATTSAAQTVTMTALTGDPLVTGPASLSGPNADDFAITADDCASRPVDTVTTGTTCTVSVNTSPTGPGLRTATLAIPDGTARGNRLVTLTASGTVPPSAPGGLTATTEGDGVSLHWTAPTDNGGSAITKYSVYRGDTAADLAWLADTPTLSYADTVSATTAAGHDYVYAVAATNAAGTGPQSAPAGARTPDTVAIASTAPSVLTVDGSLGSYIAGGKSWGFVANGGGDVVSVSGSPSSLSVNGRNVDFTHFYSVTLAAPTGQRLVTGTTYSTQQFSDTTHGRLDVGGDGSGCGGQSAGSFTVREAVFTASGAPLRIAVDYEFRCGSATAPPVDGVIRFGSDVDWTGVTVDVPTTPAPVGVATDEVEHVRNIGTTTVTLGPATLHAGPPWDPDTSGDWSLSNDGCNGVVLQPGDSCAVTLQVTPAASGPREVGLAITDDTPLGTHDRYLSVMGVVPPPAPGYINATAAAGGGVHLQWSINEDYNARITSWEVLRGTTPDDLVVVASVPRSSVAPTWDDIDTTAGPRVYGVRAINVAGTGPLITTALDYGPGAPQAVTAVALAHSVGLTWQPPATVNSGTVTYRVLSGSAPGALTDVTPTTATSVVLPSLGPGTTRYLSVEAVYDGTAALPGSPVVSATAADSQLVEADANGVLRAHAMTGGPGIPITDGFAVHDTPAASPDGQTLAYTAGSSIYLPGHIVVRAADGSGAPTQLTSSAYHDDSPVFTPDGHRIYFVRWSGTSNIHSVLTAGGGESTLPNSTQLYDPTITPDGRTLIATDGSSAAAPLARINLADGTYAKTPIPGTAYGSSPSVSPDGRKLSYINASGVVQVIPIAGGAPTTVQTPPGVINTSWSADGKWIYASAVRANGSSDLWQLHADGQGWPTMITGTDLVDEGWVTTDTIDTAPPTVTMASLPAVALGSQVKASWSGTDALSAVTSYDVRVDRVASDGTDLGWQSLVIATPNTSVAVPLPTDFQTCVSVRGRDHAGNVSPWSPSRCTIRPMDDAWMIASAAVTRAKGTAYYSGTISRTTTKGAVLSRSGMRGKRFDVIATTCPTCGTVEVRVGTHLLGTLSLHSATIRHRVVLALPLQSTTLRGTLRIRVTSSGKLVEIDGAGVGRQ